MFTTWLSTDASRCSHCSHLFVTKCSVALGVNIVSFFFFLFLSDIMDYLLREGNNIDVKLTSITTVNSTTIALDCQCSSADFAVLN